MEAPPQKRKPKQVSRLKRPYKNAQGKTVMLTDQQKQFTDAVIGTKNSRELLAATKLIYSTDTETARVVASENIRKPNIIEYLGDRGYQALDVLTEAMKDKQASWSDRIRAADSVADRQFGRATQRVEQHSTSVNIGIDLSGTLSNDQDAQTAQN